MLIKRYLILTIWSLKLVLIQNSQKLKTKIPVITKIATKDDRDTKALEIENKMPSNFFDIPEFNILAKINADARMVEVRQIIQFILDLGDKNRKRILENFKHLL